MLGRGFVGFGLFYHYLLRLTFAASDNPVDIINYSGRPIDIYWVNPKASEKLVKQAARIQNQASATISSYYRHQFVIRFSEHEADIETNFTKGLNEETVTVFYDKGSRRLFLEQLSKEDNVLDDVVDLIAPCSGMNGSYFSDCVRTNMRGKVEAVVDKMKVYKDSISSLSKSLQRYACDDEALESSKPVSVENVTLGDVTYRIDTLLNYSHAQIWTVNNFMTDKECDVLIEAGRPTLKKAYVRTANGTSTLDTSSRRAQQAGYFFPREGRESDPLWPLINRVLGLTNHFGGFQLGPDGQEPLHLIQYNVGDEYRPHCDASCDGSKHIKHGRVATAVMYCKIADLGGATTFTTANLRVKPKPGLATFFTYKGPDGFMDEGYTEHSGCPVRGGEKWIATYWMREGVSKEEPSTWYDTKGVPLQTDEEEEERDLGGDEDKAAVLEHHISGNTRGAGNLEDEL